MEPSVDEEVDLTAEVSFASPDLHDPAQRGSVERGLLAVEAVTSVRIVPGFGRPIDELHVVATEGRDVKQIVRDLQSLLMARFAIATDHRVISVVQLDERDHPSAARRVVMSEVSVTHQGLAVSAEVSVVDRGRELNGRSEGPASAAGRRRATARATLDALRPLLGASRAVEVEGVEIAQVLGHEVALCIVHFHSRTGEETAVGSALVSRDESDAIARAVLDALNRTIAHDDKA